VCAWHADADLYVQCICTYSLSPWLLLLSFGSMHIKKLLKIWILQY